jgi:hypothetical protein
MGLKPARVQSSIRTHLAVFREPAFALLGNPAPLYSELLKRLAKHGATVGSLNLDVGNLETAHVLCQLRDATVRVRLLGLEVVFHTFKPLKTHQEIFEASLAAVFEADHRQGVGRYDLTLGVWVEVDGGYEKFIDELIPSSKSGDISFTTARAAWKVSIGQVSGVISIEAGAERSETLFARIALSYPDSLGFAGANASFDDDILKCLGALGLGLETAG